MKQMKTTSIELYGYTADINEHPDGAFDFEVYKSEGGQVHESKELYYSFEKAKAAAEEMINDVCEFDGMPADRS